MEEGYRNWNKKKSYCKERDYSFITTSGEKVKDLYTPLDIKEKDFMNDIGYPGEYPFTRGVYTNMYRGRLWTMRQFSGFGTAEDTNKRYRYLLENGQTGLSVAFDFPTLMGRDSDDPLSNGEVGVCGVAVDSLQDMETIFKGIPLDKVSTSMTINGPAIVLLALYVATGERQGIAHHKLTGTLQNDILKEYMAQHAYIFPPRPALKLIIDIIEFCTNEVPKWNTISISGYHIREAGSTAVQELAFTLADGFTYVEEAIKAGIDVDKFAPRLSFFFNSHNDFFEEIAKFRAARRIWARHMKEKYGAKNPRSWLMRFHTQTAGCSLTAQQPENNIARVTIQAMAAVLGGTQSLHTNSMDETWALPTKKAATIALRTQQIIAFESGVANTIDPLAGSYFVESLTDKMEEQAEEYFEKIEKIGGVIKGIEEGYFQREIAKSASQYQKEIETKERIIVGVNEFVMKGEELEIPILKIDPEVEKAQKERLAELKNNRSQEDVKNKLKKVKEAAEKGLNLVPPILDAVRVYATEGEIISELKNVFGEWKEPKIL
ncbi:methylmalonyl-CoA mutase [candidate division KSB1 bacterium]|nr:MAG: methylmalonyl-CoA mutase [candidate division KSB1 bacterium]